MTKSKQTNSEICDSKTLQRIIEIGELKYINRHGFTSIKSYTFDRLAERKQLSLSLQTANKLKFEITRLANLARKISNKPKFEHLQQMYKDSHFKPFSMLKNEMGSGFVMRVKKYKDPYESSFKEGEEESIKLIMMRIYNELSF